MIQNLQAMEKQKQGGSQGLSNIGDQLVQPAGDLAQTACCNADPIETTLLFYHLYLVYIKNSLANFTGFSLNSSL